MGLAISGVLNADASLSWSANPNTDIPDGQPDSGLLSAISIDSGDLQLSGIVDPWVSSVVSISFEITGGWNGDYIIQLKHVLPDLTTDTLTILNRVGMTGGQPLGYMNAGYDVTIETGGSGDIADQGSYSSSSQITGTYGGVDFSSLAGYTKSPVGTWALYITDNSSGDVGTLVGWSLTLDVVPEPTTWAAIIFGTLFAGVQGVRLLRKKKLMVES